MDGTTIMIIAGIGIFVFSIIFFCTTLHYFSKSRRLKKDVDRLNEKINHLNETIAQTIVIPARENNDLRKKVAELETQIRNQQSDIQTLKETGNKKDAIELQRYNRCAKIIATRIPNFFPIWESCMDEVRREEEKEDKGIKRIFRSFTRLLSGEKEQRGALEKPIETVVSEPNKLLDTPRKE